jgi:hypothetical protein
MCWKVLKDQNKLYEGLLKSQARIEPEGLLVALLQLGLRRLIFKLAGS